MKHKIAYILDHKASLNKVNNSSYKVSTLTAMYFFLLLIYFKENFSFMLKQHV